MGKASKKKKRSDQVSYYHGGFPGLQTGNQVLPPETTEISLRWGYTSFDPQRVFVTTSLELATAYALLFARRAPTDATGYSGPALGSVYEVKVRGPKTEDEDFAELAQLRGGHFSYSVVVPPEITRVVTSNLRPNYSQENRLFAPFQTWESPDGKVYPMWTDSGYMMPNPRDIKRGLTWQMIEERDRMGAFPGKEMLIQKGYYVD